MSDNDIFVILGNEPEVPTDKPNEKFFGAFKTIGAAQTSLTQTYSGIGICSFGPFDNGKIMVECPNGDRFIIKQDVLHENPTHI